MARQHDGLATRSMLRGVGLSSDDIRTEVDAGRWTRLGTHTIGVTVREADGQARWWWATWESGPGAALDGVSGLLAAGLSGWSETTVHISVPHTNRVHRLPGVRLHRLRRVGELTGAAHRRTRPEIAVLRAAEWAASDRQAATILVMTVQQGITTPERIAARWATIRRSARRKLLDRVIGDISDGARALGELDFAARCRARGLPEPTRQVVRHGPRGRVYLDVWWDEPGIHAEIDGIHHSQDLAPVDDALRNNAVAIGGATCLRIPVLGLRLYPDQFLDQVEAAHAAAWQRLTDGVAQRQA